MKSSTGDSDDEQHEIELDEFVQKSSRNHEGFLCGDEASDTETLFDPCASMQGLQPGRHELSEFDGSKPQLANKLPSWAPARIGRFDIQSVLGAGGFAVVYLAEDRRLDRMVALKVPRPEALARPELRRRFLTEAQAAAKLDHPNIVQVFEAGEDGDLPYIACAWCEGPTLATWIASRNAPIAPKLAATIVRDVANAVQYSYEHGILHRDIKPGNILLFPQPSRKDDRFPFVPRLGDFGLAKLLESGQQDSMASQLIGTPAYMAPELVNGTGKAGSVAPDVYALGAVLYCLVIGHAPFLSDTVAETLRKVIEHDPVAPTVTNPYVGSDLSLICMKCLQKTPEQRYTTPAELAEDLNRYLTGEPVRARRTSIPQRIQKWCRRKPQIAALLAVSVGLASLLVILAARYTFSLQNLQGQLETSNDQLQQRVTDLNAAIVSANSLEADADAQRDIAEQQVFAADLHTADSLRLTGDIRGVRRILDKYDSAAPAFSGIDGHESFAWRYLKQRTSVAGTSLPDTGQIAWDMKLSPDGSRIAMCGDKGIIRILDVHNGFQTIVERQIASTEFNNVAWCDSEPILATCGDGGIVRICDAESLQLLREFEAIPMNQSAQGVAFLPGTTQLIVVGSSPDLLIWDAVSGQQLQAVQTPNSTVLTCVAVTDDGKHIAAGGDDGVIHVWRADDYSLLWKNSMTNYIGQSAPVSVCRFTPNGKYLAVVGAKQSVFLFDAATGEEIRHWHGLDKIHAMVADNDRILCGDTEGLLSEFSLEGGDREWLPDKQWLGHETKVSSIAFSSMKSDENSAVLSLSADRSGKLWSWPADSSVQTQEFPGVESRAEWATTGLCWKDSDTLLRRGQTGVESLSLTTGKIEQVFSSPSPVACCQYAQDARCLVIGNDQGEVTVIPDGQDASPSVSVFENDRIQELSVDRAATTAVVRGFSNEVAVIDLDSGQIRAMFADREASAVSPDGRWVISGRRTTDAFEVFDGKTMELQRSLPDFDPTYSSIVFSTDSKWLVATHSDRTIAVWDTATWKLVKNFSSRSRGMNSIVIHSDGRTVATFHVEGNIRLWDAVSGRELVDIGTYGAGVFGAEFSPDGESLGVCHGNLDVTVIHVPK